MSDPFTKLVQRQAGRPRRRTPSREDLPDLREDPWFYLDLDHGDDRLRRLLARQDAPGRPQRPGRYPNSGEPP